MKTQFTTITGGHHRLPASNATCAAHSAKSWMFPALKTLKQLFGGPRIFALAGLLTMAAITAPAADTVDASVAYRPGDTVRVIVTFKPVSLKSAMLRFYLQGALPAGQKVFAQLFDANSFTKLSDREFELAGKIGDHVATGAYQLSFINATDDADFTRNFNAPQDLPVVTISARNDRRVEFPDISAVKVSPAASKP